MTRALFIGRFQPFHKGHEYAIDLILESCDELIIGIGSAYENYTLENPLTCGERIEILWHYLKGRDLLDRCFICTIPDIHNNFLWPRHVISLVPKFDVVYSGNNLVLLLFQSANIPIRRIQEVDKDSYSGTTIRQLILDGKPWRHLVPKTVVPLLDEIGFETRLRNLAKKRTIQK